MPGVVHIITALERGGAQRNTLETVAQLHRSDRPQWLYTGPAAAMDDEASARLGARFFRLKHLVHPISPMKDLLALIEISRMLEATVKKMGAPIVVHTHSSKAGLLGRLAARSIQGVRSVFTQHGFAFDGLAANKRWIAFASERLAGAATDEMIFVSDDDRQVAKTLGLAKGARHRVIRSGVSESPFNKVDRSMKARKGARKALGLDENAPLAVTIGNLKLQKDPLLHVRILEAWRKLEPDAELFFVGDGPLRKETESLAKTLHVEDALHLPGFVSDPLMALEAADVFLLASAWEGLPRASLEAILAGLPMVLRECGYVHELEFVEKGLHGIPFDASPDAFARALCQREHSPERALPERFTLRGMLNDLDKLYDELLM
ncbi:MAG: glycosyltransferase family 4 protein [Deltaproteobacteria bacterium]|nr:glycosyltransferase family 4 protein [Deltaproteobacteria bacterium]